MKSSASCHAVLFAALAFTGLAAPVPAADLHAFLGHR